MPVITRHGGYQATVNHQYDRYRKQFKLEDDAEMWCLQLRKALRNGDPIDHLISDDSSAPKASKDARNQRLDVVLDKTYRMFWADKASAEDARRKIKELLNFYGNNTNVRDVTTISMDDFVIACKNKGNSGATVNRKLSVLSKALKYAVDRDILIKKPPMPFQQESKGLTVYVETYQETKFIETLTHWGDQFTLDSYITLVDTGLRKGEFLQIRRKHVTADGMLKVGYDYKTKNGEPRTIALTDRVREILERRSVKRGRDERLFDVSPNTLDTRWKRIRAALGYNDIKIHTLRHTCASRLAQRGAPLQTIMRWMGHKDLKVTMRYQHLCPENITEAMKLLNNIAK
jgi:integrase